MATLPTDGTDPWGDQIREWLLAGHLTSGLVKAHQHSISEVTGLSAALASNVPAPNPDFPPAQPVSYNVGGAKTGKVLVYINSNLVVVSDDADPAGIYTRTVAQLTGEAPIPPVADIFPSDDLQAEIAAMGNGNTVILAPGDYGSIGEEFFMSGTDKEIIALDGARWVGGQFRVTGSGHTWDNMTFDQRSVPGKDVEFTGDNFTAIRCKFTNQYTGIKTYLGSGGRTHEHAVRGLLLLQHRPLGALQHLRPRHLRGPVRRLNRARVPLPPGDRRLRHPRLPGHAGVAGRGLQVPRFACLGGGRGGRQPSRRTT